MSFDIQISEMLNKSKVGNFVFAPVGNVCNVQIFDKIGIETCGEMVGTMAHIITQLPSKPVIDKVSAMIESPYDIPEHRFVFDVSINSTGGEYSAYKAIASMFALAKSRGAIIRTNNIGRANSAASMLAIQGTPGYRLMSQNAINFIHHGNSTFSGSRADEADIALKNNKIDREETTKVYKIYTKLTDKNLEKFFSVEGSGVLFAEQCLNKQLCDWIVTSDGRFIGRQR